MDAKQRFPHHVLGLENTADHPIRDRERDWPQPVEQPRVVCHAAPDPCRRLGPLDRFLIRQNQQLHG